MDMDRMAGRYRQLQRATVARSVLDVIALIFLCAGFCFWSVAFWQLLTPPALLSALTIQVIVLALVYSLATPLLWSALVPSTPAGQLLQKTQWRTFGFAAIVGSALYLSFQAEMMIELWLSAQPGVAEAGFARSLAFSLSIGFILIPALAWTQLTPERWLAQIQQAHQVKKLEMQQRGELAIIKASILSAERKALLGWANLLPLERQEVMLTLRGLLTSTSDVQRDIVRTLGLGAELERDIMSDETIARQLDYVAERLDVLPDLRPIEAPADIPAETGETRALARTPDRAPSPSERAEHAAVPHTKPHSDTVSTRVAVRQGDARRDEAYTLAYEQLSGRAWTVRELGELLDVAESTARDIRIRWTHAGLVTGEGLPNGRYNFTESEAR